MTALPIGTDKRKDIQSYLPYSAGRTFLWGAAGDGSFVLWAVVIVTAAPNSFPFYEICFYVKMAAVIHNLKVKLTPLSGEVNDLDIFNA